MFPSFPLTLPILLSLESASSTKDYIIYTVKFFIVFVFAFIPNYKILRDRHWARCPPHITSFHLITLYYLCFQTDQQMNGLFEGFPSGSHSRAQTPSTAVLFLTGSRTLRNRNKSGRSRPLWCHRFPLAVTRTGHQEFQCAGLSQTTQELRQPHAHNGTEARWEPTPLCAEVWEGLARDTASRLTLRRTWFKQAGNRGREHKVTQTTEAKGHVKGRKARVTAWGWSRAWGNRKQ